MRKTTIALAFLVAWFFAVPIGWAQNYGDKEHAELAKALTDAKISLQRGLTASAKGGKPISAKYEVEDGKLQLSVYTMKGDTFSEVIVDHKTGKVAKAEPITSGDDLTAAKGQSEAMAKAKRSLDAAASEAVQENKGYRVVRVMPGAPVGKGVLVQRATKNQFNVIVAPAGPFTDLDVSVKFDPLSGKEDASGGIVFRFNDGKYYVVRANALEGNFRLYYYDRGRRELASASVKAPALGQWHMIRVVAVGNHIQGWLDGALLLAYRDSRFRSGRVGLWTKADSITAFNDLTIYGVTAGGS